MRAMPSPVKTQNMQNLVLLPVADSTAVRFPLLLADALQPTARTQFIEERYQSLTRTTSTRVSTRVQSRSTRHERAPSRPPRGFVAPPDLNHHREVVACATSAFDAVVDAQGNAKRARLDSDDST